MELLDELLGEITEEQQAKVERKMRIASMIAEGLVKKGMGKKQFAEKIGRNPSEITKWLSGTHNFTIETLTDIERVLNLRILNIQTTKTTKPFQNKTIFATV